MLFWGVKNQMKTEDILIGVLAGAIVVAGTAVFLQVLLSPLKREQKAEQIEWQGRKREPGRHETPPTPSASQGAFMTERAER